MSRGRSSSPRQMKDTDVDMDNHSLERKSESKVIIVNNLSRNVFEPHLKLIFSFYGDILKIDLPLYGKSGQNRGKAALEFSEPVAAQRAVKHMNGGQLDGSSLTVELSDLPIRGNSRSPPRGGGGGRARGGYRNGRDRPRSFSRSRSRTSRSRSRSRHPPSYRRRGGFSDSYGRDRDRDSFRGRGGGFGRRGPPGRPRDVFYRPARSRSRSRSPIRRGGERPLPPRRRSPSYTRGGYGRRRSRSYSVRSSRSRTRSYSRSKSRSRSMSYSSDSRYTRSRSRTRSVSRARRTRSRSRSRDDIRDSRSRSPR